MIKLAWVCTSTKIQSPKQFSGRFRDRIRTKQECLICCDVSGENYLKWPSVDFFWGTSIFWSAALWKLVGQSNAWFHEVFNLFVLSNAFLAPRGSRGMRLEAALLYQYWSIETSLWPHVGDGKRPYWLPFCDNLWSTRTHFSPFTGFPFNKVTLLFCLSLLVLRDIKLIKLLTCWEFPTYPHFQVSFNVIYRLNPTSDRATPT